MAKDPAFLFYTSDFLIGTSFMTDAQVGKYIRLLCFQHQKGKLTLKDMMKICKKREEIIWEKFERDQHGFYFNLRLREESEKRRKYAISRRNNRLSKSYDKDMINHMENETENEITYTGEKDSFTKGIPGVD